MVKFEDKFEEDGWCNAEAMDEPINEGHYHEMIDRSFVVVTMIEEIIVIHPAIDDEMLELAHKAIQHLMDIGNIAAKKLINYEE